MPSAPIDTGRPLRRRLGFLINPVAGLGGRVGLKGSDDVVDQALALGARPQSTQRALETLSTLREALRSARSAAPHWLTCAGSMGADCLQRAGFADFEICHPPASAQPPTQSAGARVLGSSSAADTAAATAAFLQRGAELVLFCGGDGTARDVHLVAGETPILGIPAGVKMYSGVFALSPRAAAGVALAFLRGQASIEDADILDLDEARYREGEWSVRLFAVARTPRAHSLIQASKQVIDEPPDSVSKSEIARHVVEHLEREVRGGASGEKLLVVLGPGNTVAAVSSALGIDATLLGVDAVVLSGDEGGVQLEQVQTDVAERQLLDLLGRHSHRHIVLSPMGAAGFVLGRGNQQISPRVMVAIGRSQLIIVATPSKLRVTPRLYFDTSDPELDRELYGSGYLPVITGYHRRRLVAVANPDRNDGERHEVARESSLGSAVVG